MGDTITLKCFSRSTYYTGFLCFLVLKNHYSKQSHSCTCLQFEAPSKLSQTNCSYPQNQEILASEFPWQQVSSQQNILWYQPTGLHVLTRKMWYQENKTTLTHQEASSIFLLIIAAQEQSGAVLHIQRHKKRR